MTGYANFGMQIAKIQLGAEYPYISYVLYFFVRIRNFATTHAEARALRVSKLNYLYKCINKSSYILTSQKI